MPLAAAVAETIELVAAAASVAVLAIEPKWLAAGGAPAQVDAAVLVVGTPRDRTLHCVVVFRAHNIEPPLAGPAHGSLVHVCM